MARVASLEALEHGILREHIAIKPMMRRNSTTRGPFPHSPYGISVQYCSIVPIMILPIRLCSPLQYSCLSQPLIPSTPCRSEQRPAKIPHVADQFLRCHCRSSILVRKKGIRFALIHHETFHRQDDRMGIGTWSPFSFDLTATMTLAELRQARCSF